jgi:glutaredoxin
VDRVDTARLYVKTTCPYSRGMLRKLDHDNVSYVTYDVERDPDRLQEMLALNGKQRAVPTIVWPDGRVEVGFHGH